MIKIKDESTPEYMLKLRARELKHVAVPRGLFRFAVILIAVLWVWTFLMCVATRDRTELKAENTRLTQELATMQRDK